jgi:hypothetical protein
MEKQEAQINPDGSVPGLLSVEEAQKISGVSAQSNVPVDEFGQPVQEPVDQQGQQPIALDENNNPIPETIDPEQDSNVPPAVQQLEEKDISIGGITKKTSEWIEEFQSEDGIDLSQLDPKVQETLLNRYIDSKNKDAWQKSLTQKNQAVSEGRKQTEALLSQVAAQESRTQYSLDQVKREITKIRGYANLNIDKNDPNLFSDPDIQRQYAKMMDAREELPSLISQQQELEQSATQIATKRLEAELSLFQHSYGHYKTDYPLSEAFRLFSTGQLDYESPDFDKVQDLIDIADHSAKRGLTFDNAYKDLKKLNKVRVKDENRVTSLPKPNETQKRPTLVQSIAKNQSGARFLSGAGSRQTVRPSKPQKSTGDLIRESSQRAVGSGGNEGLSKLGY